MIPFILLGRPDSFAEYPSSLGIPASLVEVEAGRIEDGEKCMPIEEVRPDSCSVWEPTPGLTPSLIPPLTDEIKDGFH